MDGDDKGNNRAAAAYPSRQEYTVRVLLTAGILIALLVVLFLAWYLVDILLLVFGGALLAILLRGAALPITRYTGLPMAGSLILVLLLLIGIVTFFIWYVAPVLAQQTNSLLEELPASVEKLRRTLLKVIPLPAGASGSLNDVDWQQLAGATLKRVVSILSLSFGAIVNFVIILFVGIYLAFSPGPYLRGVIRLVPVSRRYAAGTILERLGYVLRWWLVGQFAAMAFIGTFVAVGLWIIGISPALVLGVAAGILEFIPYVGPLLGFLPIFVLAVPLGGQSILYVLVLYLLVQSLEGYVVTPLVQRRAVDLPPVVTVMSQAILALLVGFLGLLFATPLVACVVVLVDMIYVKGILESKPIPEEETAKAGD
jgi:predicted PurR-regulated permease PerM